MLRNVLNHISVGCPTQIRADLGTENGLVAATQICFRSTGTDSLAGSKSVCYGTSPANVVRTNVYTISGEKNSYDVLFHRELKVGGQSCDGTRQDGG